MSFLDELFHIIVKSRIKVGNEICRRLNPLTVRKPLDTCNQQQQQHKLY
jgi:hypothetical protein